MLRRLAFLVILLAIPSITSAQGDAETEAQLLLERAMNAREADDMPFAAQLLREALELAPLAGVAFNLAEVSARVGDNCGAAVLYQSLIDGDYGERTDEELTQVRPLLREARDRTATLQISIEGAEFANTRIGSREPVRMRQSEETSFCVEAGRHALTAEATGCDTHTRTVRTEAGDFSRIRLALEPRARPVYKRPWFWIGTSLLVLGGAALTTGLLLARPPASVEDDVTGNLPTALRFSLP